MYVVLLLQNSILSNSWKLFSKIPIEEGNILASSIRLLWYHVMLLMKYQKAFAYLV